MSLDVQTNTQVFRGYWAKDYDGNNVTGLTLADFDVTLRYKTASASSYSSASESVTLAELDSANLPGQYEFRFTPTTEAKYILEVVPKYSGNLGDSFRSEWNVVETLEVTGNTLCTKEQVKAYVPIDATVLDDLIDDLIDRVTKWVQSYTGLQIFSASFTEYYDGKNSSELVLNERPVESVTSVHESTDVPRSYGTSELLTADEEYILEEDSGILHRIAANWPSGPKTVKVVYTAGWSAVPNELNGAAVRMVGILLVQRARLGMSSESMGEGTGGFYDWRQWPHDVVETLNRYRDLAKVVA